jgi:hypothetical protein
MNKRQTLFYYFNFLHIAIGKSIFLLVFCCVSLNHSFFVRGKRRGTGGESCVSSHVTVTAEKSSSRLEQPDQCKYPGYFRIGNRFGPKDM